MANTLLSLASISMSLVTDGPVHIGLDLNRTLQPGQEIRIVLSSKLPIRRERVVFWVERKTDSRGDIPCGRLRRLSVAGRLSVATARQCGGDGTSARPQCD